MRTAVLEVVKKWNDDDLFQKTSNVVDALKGISGRVSMIEMTEVEVWRG